ncbi:MAG: polymer-forming cytoskeletal protein [Nitrospira sp.]|nr:polymer-forming cytoskeletal protein [Nitrospira sp.]
MWGTREKIAQTVSDNEDLTLFGKGTHFKGTVHCDGAIRIDGKIEGEIHTTGSLVVGEQGIIKGLISAGTVTVSGKINGTVKASQKIQVLVPGILIGDLHAPAIAIEDGAHFHGMSNMGAQKWVEDPSAPNTYTQELPAYRGRMRPSVN